MWRKPRRRMVFALSTRRMGKGSVVNIIANRQKPRKEMVMDGYKGFLLLDKEGKPKVALHLEHVMKRVRDKYNAPTRSSFVL